jgi:hypothetical protein
MRNSPVVAVDTEQTPMSGSLTGPRAAAGPLVVARANPRYFAVDSGNADDQQAVYLTGSHIWNNFHDGVGSGTACADQPEQNDYRAYVDFLTNHGHNFIRLWRWEHFKSQALAGIPFHLCMSPQPWPRIGPGAALDGGPKFDLARFDQAYFDRLRDRVIAAGNEGIYVAVMLFDGFALHLSPAPDNIEGHPFHAANNINGIGITSIVDYQVLPLDPRVQSLQEAYLRQVLDTVHDLPNVLYEVANESSGDTADVSRLPDRSSIPTPIGDSTLWQYWVIDFVKQYEQQQGYDKHPVGMTMQYPVPNQSKVNESLFDSSADWISPGSDDEATAAPGEAAAAVAHRSARQRRHQGRDHRHRPLCPRHGRRTVGMEVLPPRPSPDPPGLRDYRRREPARSVAGGPAVRVLRTGSLRDGRHTRLRRADEPHPDAASRRSQLDRICARESRQGIPCSRSDRKG